MDLRILNTFIEVAERSSFTKAAEALHFSQPTVSFQIRQLEEELGEPLFDRVGHTVSLTARGRETLIYAQQICRLSEEMMMGDHTAASPSGCVRIAMADSLCEPLLGGFSSLHSQYPNIELNVKTAGTDELFRLLDHNEVDLVCTLDSHIYSQRYCIYDEERVGVHFVCSSAHPLSRCEELSLDTLLQEPMLLTEKGMSYRRLLDEHLAERSLEAHPVLEIYHADLICRLVQKGDFISFLPDYVTEQAVREGRLVRLSVENFEVEIWKQILYRRDKWLSLPIRAMLTYLSLLRIVKS